MEGQEEYQIILDEDNTLKTFFERFYVLPNEGKDWEKEQRAFLEKHRLRPTNENTKNGKNGYIVFRNIKVTKEIAEIIKNDTGSQRAKAKKYGLSVGTINKIMNDKY